MATECTDKHGCKTITWDRPMLERFKKAYAGIGNGETFLFDDHEFLGGYAKYLIEYLEARLA